jgi:hypothetical protein
MLDYVKGFFLGLVAPVVMVFGAFLAIPDMVRILRMRAMSRGTVPHA